MATRSSRSVPDPILRFARWFRAAAGSMPQPEAMALATSGRDGRPSVRMVLLKGFGPRGFRFFTSRLSRKARELEHQPRAALVLHWPATGRQVRIEGRVRPLSEAESDVYFRERPRASQLSAAVSPQSRVIRDYASLVRARKALARAFVGRPIPRPAHWGGYSLAPDSIEFWSQGPARLHRRERFRRRGRAWTREWLAP